MTLSIFNLAGQLVHTLVDEQQNTGVHSCLWDASNDFGVRVSSGIYLYKLQVLDGTSGREAWFAERKMRLLK